MADEKARTKTTTPRWSAKEQNEKGMFPKTPNAGSKMASGKAKYRKALSAKANGPKRPNYQAALLADSLLYKAGLLPTCPGQLPEVSVVTAWNFLKRE